jgi:hypothetical protein
LTHGKGDKASRDPWTSVAKARHNRDANGVDEPALDVLEKYLPNSRHITQLQKELWSGDYQITVLHELIRKLGPILSFTKLTDFAASYPGKKIPSSFDELIKEIGEKNLGFEEIRSEDSFNLILNRLGIPIPSKNNEATDEKDTVPNGKNAKKQKKAPSKKLIAISNSDPKYIIQTLKKFIILGDDREKVAALRDEAIRLKDIQRYPYSFCFLLRSMFELSGKIYCKENGITTYTLKDGKKFDKKLVDILKESRKHLVANAEVPKVTEQLLHGAITELTKPEGLLSVTSLNNLVHNPNFSTSGENIASIFSNVFPLLKLLNS